MHVPYGQLCSARAAKRLLRNTHQALPAHSMLLLSMRGTRSGVLAGACLTHTGALLRHRFGLGALISVCIAPVHALLVPTPFATLPVVRVGPRRIGSRTCELPIACLAAGPHRLHGSTSLYEGEHEYANRDATGLVLLSAGCSDPVEQRSCIDKQMQRGFAGTRPCVRTRRPQHPLLLPCSDMPDDCLLPLAQC